MIHQTRQQLYALHAQHRIHQDAHYIAVQIAAHRKRGAIVAALADCRIGALTEELIVALGVNTTARSVLISAERQRHILERRQLVSTFDADLALRRLQEALEQRRFLVKDEGSDTTFKVVCWVSSAERYVLVALKFVPSARSKKGDDECWVQTAYPFGTKKFRRFMQSGKLILPRFHGHGVKQHVSTRTSRD
jgi:hypothetical protein